MEAQRKACKNSQYAISFNMPNLCIIATVYSLIHFVMCYSHNLEKEAELKDFSQHPMLFAILTWLTKKLHFKKSF